MIAEAQLNFTEAQCNAYGKLLLDMIALADRNLVADKILSRTTSMLDNPKAGSVYFRRFLKSCWTRIFDKAIKVAYLCIRHD